MDLDTLTALGALLLGLVIGWVVGRNQGKRELTRYREGVVDASSSCWVRSQLPPGSDP